MNAEIVEFRKEIEQLDKSILETLEKRFEICKKIGDNKKANRLPIEDLEREREIIESKIKNSNLNPELTKRLFKLIFEESKRLQNES